jgi:uncharacterized protein YwqG
MQLMVAETASPVGSAAWYLSRHDETSCLERRQALPEPIRRAAFQAVLLKQHIPPRFNAASRSWFGGVPLVKPEFVWPSTQYQHTTNKPLTFIMQIDCGRIPESARLGIMPDHGLLQFFADMDWGNGFGHKVLWNDADAGTLKAANEPKDLQPIFGSETQYFRTWHSHVDDAAVHERILPRWTFEPMVIFIPENHYDDASEEDEPIFLWEDEDRHAEIAWLKQGDVAAIYAKDTHYDDQGNIARPFPSFPHNWRAIQICTGLMIERGIDSRARVNGKPLSDLEFKERQEIISSIMHEAHDWFESAKRKDPFSATPQNESDIFWSWLLNFSDIARYFLDQAIPMSIEDTISHSSESASQIPFEAFSFLRNRHLLIQKTQNGFTRFRPHRMLAPPSAVQWKHMEMAPNHILLLELSENDGLGHHLGDGVLQFWIRPEDLQARNFDRVVLTAEA